MQHLYFMQHGASPVQLLTPFPTKKKENTCKTAKKIPYSQNMQTNEWYCDEFKVEIWENADNKFFSLSAFSQFNFVTKMTKKCQKMTTTIERKMGQKKHFLSRKIYRQKLETAEAKTQKKWKWKSKTSPQPHPKLAFFLRIWRWGNSSHSHLWWRPQPPPSGLLSCPWL